MQYRRLREFALRALASQRRGLRREADAEAQTQIESDRVEEYRLHKKNLEDMVKTALKDDKKWVREVT